MKIGQKNISDLNQTGFISNKVAGEVGFKFQDELGTVREKNRHETLIELTKDIFAQGEVITSRCDIKELKRYKDLIADFFNEIMSAGFEFSKEGKYDSRGQKKIYANVKNVNDNIEKLASELLKAQKDQVEIVNIVEDIRGIILDTFV